MAVTNRLTYVRKFRIEGDKVVEVGFAPTFANHMTLAEAALIKRHLIDTGVCSSVKLRSFQN